MEKGRKTQIKRTTSWICLGVVVVLLTLLPAMAGSGSQTGEHRASILSGTVTLDTVSQSLQGGGVLEAETVEVTIPFGVKITQFLVENGDRVSQGDALAQVDKVSLMTAISQVQQSMDQLQEQMADAKDESVSESVKAEAGGRVKEIYAQPGETVQEVMLRDGCLAVLSLDGLMAADIERNTELATGETVLVNLADGTEVTGRVASNLNGCLVVTVEDEGYQAGQTVSVDTQEGKRLGSGELYIHSPWRATAYSGTVSKVHAEPEDKISTGAKLFTLTDTEFTAQLSSLSQLHREYEQLMLQMFQMYQTGVIAAPQDGLVSGVEEDSVHLLSGAGEGWTLTRLANAPGGDPDASFSNYAGMVTSVDTLTGTWSLTLNPTPYTVEDYLDVSAVPLDTGLMTQAGAVLNTTPVYTYDEETSQWIQMDAESITPGTLLIFAGDGGGSLYWAIYAGTGQLPGGSEGQIPGGGEGQLPGGIAIPDGSIQIPSGVRIPSGMTGSAAQQEEEEDLYDLDGSTLLTLSSLEQMKLTITVDQQDIAKVQTGQEAQVTVDALGGKTYSAQVTQVGAIGSNQGGSSKFTVELTMERPAQMLDGMSAQASVFLEDREQALTVPVEALVEQGADTLIYTGYDPETEQLTDPVTVTLGASDGLRVEILSGLEENDAFYYAYYDTLEISDEVESNQFSFAGR